MQVVDAAAGILGTAPAMRMPVCSLLDPVVVAAKTDEMVVDIKKGTGLAIPSRVGLQALPSKGDLTRVRSIFGLLALGHREGMADSDRKHDFSDCGWYRKVSAPVFTKG